jgi:hypothetical protein
MAEQDIFRSQAAAGGTIGRFRVRYLIPRVLTGISQMPPIFVSGRYHDWRSRATSALVGTLHSDLLVFRGLTWRL